MNMKERKEILDEFDAIWKAISEREDESLTLRKEFEKFTLRFKGSQFDE